MILLILHCVTRGCAFQNVAYICTLHSSGPGWRPCVSLPIPAEPRAGVHADWAIFEGSPLPRRTSCTLWLQTKLHAHHWTNCYVRRRGLPVGVELSSPKAHNCYTLGLDRGLPTGQGIKQMSARLSQCPGHRGFQAGLTSGYWDVCRKLIILSVFSLLNWSYILWSKDLQIKYTSYPKECIFWAL